MSEQDRVYIAGIGMITPVGANTAMTAAAVRAGHSGYQTSNRFTKGSRQPIVMARVPEEVFANLPVKIDEGRRYCELHDHVIKMAIVALREAVSGCSFTKPAPLILAVPEAKQAFSYLERDSLVKNLVAQNGLPIYPDLVRDIASGRAAGFEGLELAFHHLSQQKAEYVLLGGSDSHEDALRLSALESSDRLLTPESKDGFAPGEGAGFLLLTGRPELALARNGCIVALNPPGIADEPGHLHSKLPYRGDGLDQAFKKALGQDPPPNAIHSIYSSMNGEHHWAKEYGVAYTRNRDAFKDPVGVEHPADCYGDLGAATAPVLIALAAEHLFSHAQARAHLVYSSSDYAKRGAVVVEKIVIEKGLAHQAVGT